MPIKLYTTETKVVYTMDQVWKREYIWIYFHSRLLGEKINLNLFSLPFIGDRKYI